MRWQEARPAAGAAAAVAVLLAVASFGPMFAGDGWWEHVVVPVVGVALVGTLVRAAGGRWFVTAPVQLGALAVLATVRFAPTEAPAGFLPTPAVGAELARLVRAGLGDVDELVVPVPATDGIALLLTLGIGLAAITVDLLAVGLRRPAPAGVPLLFVYTVPAAVLASGLAWVWFVPAACGWLLLLVADRTRPREPVAQRALSAAPVGAVAVLAAVLVAAALPGVGDGAFSGVEKRRSGPGSPDGDLPGLGRAQDARLDVSLVLNANLRSSTDVAVLGYRNQDGSPEYLRLAVVDSFDGNTWLPVEPDPDAPSTGISRLEVPGLDSSRVSTRRLQTEVRPFGSAQHLSFLPTPYLPTETDRSGVWRWDQSTSTAYSARSSLGTRAYTVLSTQAVPTRAELRRQTSEGADDQLDLPADLPPDLRRLATEVTADADGPYDTAMALQDWFRTAFDYDVAAPHADSSEAIAAFLTDRRGYCQHFAATFTLMARSLGVPARAVIGFTPGTPAAVWAERPGGFEGAGDPLPPDLPLDGSYVVSTQDYHAWPEVWFDDVGWVRFEPTPRADGTVEVPAWAPADELPRQPRPVPTDLAAEAHPEEPSGAPTDDRLDAAEDGAALLGGSTVRWAGAVVLVVVGAASLPGLLRRRLRRRRLRLAETAAAAATAPLGDPGSVGRGVEAMWAELADTATDLGLGWAEADSPRRTAAALAATAGIEPTSRAGVALAGLTREVEHARYASSDPASIGSVERVQELRASLHAGAGRRRSWQAQALPRSLFRRVSSRTRGGGATAPRPGP